MVPNNKKAKSTLLPNNLSNLTEAELGEAISGNALEILNALAAEPLNALKVLNDGNI